MKRGERIGRRKGNLLASSERERGKEGNIIESFAHGNWVMSFPMPRDEAKILSYSCIPLS